MCVAGEDECELVYGECTVCVAGNDECELVHGECTICVAGKMDVNLFTVSVRYVSSRGTSV